MQRKMTIPSTIILVFEGKVFHKQFESSVHVGGNNVTHLRTIFEWMGYLSEIGL